MTCHWPGSTRCGVIDTAQLAFAARLRATMPWVEPVIAHLEAQAERQLWLGRPWMAWRPLCLVGAPGVGKSHLAKAIADAVGLSSATLDLAGTSDNRTLEGTARGWLSTQPCWPAMMMAQTRTANPMLIVEEIDKAGGSDRNGRVLNTLLTMIEDHTARSYYDRCLLATADLSHICWVFTCNSIDTLSPMLRSRMDIIEVEAAGIEHFEQVLTAVLAGVAEQWGIASHALPDPPPRAVAILRDAYRQTRSIRVLKRQVEAILQSMIRHEPRRTH